MLSEETKEYLRCLGRGGLLDKHLGEIGNTAVIGPNEARTSAARQGDLVMINAENKANPKGICLNVDMVERRAGIVGALPGFRAQLIVTWGSGKGVARAVVDLKRGLQLVVPAATLTANCIYLDDAAFAGPTLIVSASTGYTTRPGSEQALTFTEATTAALGAASISPVPFKIPPYATRVLWGSPQDPTAFAPPDALLTFTNTDFIVGFPALSLSNPPRDTMIPIPNGAEYIRISNIGGAGSQFFLIYELSI